MKTKRKRSRTTMSNTTKKQPMSVVKKMMIALVSGLLVGIAFLLLREQLISSGNEGAWTILNKILFQKMVLVQLVFSTL